MQVFIFLFLLFFFGLFPTKLVFADTFTTVFSDDFTDADNTLLTTHNNQWQMLQGVTPVIENNTLYVSESGSNPSLPFNLSNQCASLDFKSPALATI